MTRFLLSCLTVKSVFPLLLFLIPATLSQLSAQNCDPLNDSIPPVAICNEVVYVSLGGDDPNDCYESNGTTHWGGVLTVTSAAFNSGSYDNCGGNLKITLQRQQPFSACINGLNTVNGQTPCDDATPDSPTEFERATGEAESIKFYGCEANTFQTIAMRVYQLDANGDIDFHQGQPVMNQCLINVIVQDKVPPTCTAPANVTVSCENFDPGFLAYGNPAVTENCCLDTVFKTLNYSQFDSICSKGTMTRTFRAVDCSGNSGSCTQTIVVNYTQDYYVKFPDDVIVTAPNGSNYGEPTIFGEDCEIIGISYSDEIFTMAPDADLLIERTWTIINWCTYNTVLPLTVVPNPNPNTIPSHPANLPGPIVSVDTAAIPWAPTLVKINPGDPAPTNFSTFYNPNANGYLYTQIIKITAPRAIVTGKVYLDTLDNCAFDSGEPLVAGWTVKATGLVTNTVHEAQTDLDGIYAVELSEEDTLVEITLSAPFNWAQNCPGVYTVSAAGGQTTTQDIAAHLDNSCALLSVDLTTPRLRRCFPNTYTVQACNLATETVENVSVEVALDPFMTVSNSSIPGIPLGNNAWSFDLGDLAAGVCTTFQINFILECAAPQGATHCSEAHIYPDTICDPPVQWSGADIEVTGFCDGDSVRMAISNIGAGDMAQGLEFVVVEDVIMYQSGSFQLESGEMRTIAVPANGATWRLEADEETNHPWGGLEAKAVEGCGGLNTPGLVTQFSLNTPDPFETTDCQQNVGSFDPNDKQAFPRGYGSQHLLEANTDIEYLIRFQNTGTDTAFTVVILDTLSAHLDARKVRPGAASHRYDFALLDGNVLRFRFDNILLPDSNVNEPASHGFIKFRVPQQPDNPDGTFIENSAAIYFDFNDPVITNTTFHTIGDHFILVKTDNPLGAAPLAVFPNPAASVAIFQLPDPAERAVFELSDRLGQSLRTDVFSGNQYRFERGVLPAGVYLYKVSIAGKAAYTGKVLLK